MTEDTLKEIEGRLRAATYGPWNRSKFGNQVLTGDSEQTICWLRSHFNENLINDADFIAHAHADVSLLLAEVRRLRAAGEDTAATSESPDFERKQPPDIEVKEGQQSLVCPDCICGSIWDVSLINLIPGGHSITCRECGCTELGLRWVAMGALIDLRCKG